MLDNRPCNVKTAEELDAEIRDIFALDDVGRGDEIGGTLHVHYPHESVKEASLIPLLEARSVAIEWHEHKYGSGILVRTRKPDQ